MRKLFIGLTFLTATTKIANAQHTDFGVKLGVNAAKFTNENGSDYKIKPSVNLGVLAHIHINKSFAVQPELLYSGQGTKITSDNTDINYNLGYINIPVLFQLMTASGFRFETGPQVGFLASAKRKSGSVSVDQKDSFKSTDFAWAFGIGYITASKFGFDVRYNAGLSDITKSNSSNVKNAVFQAGVFYQFK